jgi:hypothetical protein
MIKMPDKIDLFEADAAPQPLTEKKAGQPEGCPASWEGRTSTI